MSEAVGPQAETALVASQIRAMLDDMSRRVFARDLGLVDHFWSGGRFWLYGSEAHEHDETRDELQRHLSDLFSKPYRISFVFDRLSVDHHGDMAWVNAPAVLQIHHADRIAEMPYRLFALFQKVGGAWRWRVFSGSEPAAPPT